MMNTAANDANAAILKRIRNLLALAGNNPNVHEAEAAAAEAQRLMHKHQIFSATLNEADKSPIGRESVQANSGKKRAVMWQALLASMLGKRMNVRVVYIQGSDQIDAVGRGTDVAALCALYEHLRRQLDRAANVAWVSLPHVQRTALTQYNGGKIRFVDTFHAGARKAIDERMAAQRNQVALDASAEKGSQSVGLPGALAVVAMDKAKSEALAMMDRYAIDTAREIESWMKTEGFKTTTSRRAAPSSGADAFSAGFKAGHSASLSANTRGLPARRG